VLVPGDVKAFTANIAFASNVGFIPLDLDDAVVFDFDFKTAVLSTKDTSGFVFLSHGSPFPAGTHQVTKSMKERSGSGVKGHQESGNKKIAASLPTPGFRTLN
jgi:hypothetical protein